MTRLSFIINLLLLIGSTQLMSQSISNANWAKDKLSTMTLDEKVGQIFMIRAHSDLGQDHINKVKEEIKAYHVGGLCFFQGTPTEQAELTNSYQELSDTPLMIAMDAEWGLGMRHKEDAISLPKQLTLGAIQDNTLIYNMGQRVADQLQRIGTHINFAPVVDVNNNAENPVIHNRSFGEDIYNVTTKSFAYMKGMQENNIIACAKHFPGHGDTNVDSHFDLPVIKHDRQRLDSLELTPFRVMSELGIHAMMMAHLSVPALDSTINQPTSLSKKVVTDILQDELNFEGLIFTDALEMKGVANHYDKGEMEVRAFLAGNDVLLMPLDMDIAFNAIKDAVLAGRIPVSRLDRSVSKILKYKQDLKLHFESTVINVSDIDRDINTKELYAFKSKLYENAITLVKDEKNQVPFVEYNPSKIATVSLGSSTPTGVQLMLEKFDINNHFHYQEEISTTQIEQCLRKLSPFDQVIISLHDMNIYKSKEYGISQSQFDLIYQINSVKDVVLIIHGTPYALQYFSEIPTILMAYEDDVLMQESVAQAIMGVFDIKGKLPVSVAPHFDLKAGITRQRVFRLGYALPEYVGANSEALVSIDTIILEMLDKKAAPGCQILAARQGRIFYHKAFGHHTINGRKEVKLDDVYDVASVTKILASTISIMKLYDENNLNLYDPIKNYLPELDTTNKGDLIIEDILAHHAGLPGWIPFYKHTLIENGSKTERREDYYRSMPSDSFSITVTDKLFLRNDWQDSIYCTIYGCELRPSRTYKYSDLGFYLFRKMIEEIKSKNFKDYVENTFYAPMGLRNTTFNPLQRIDKSRIPPTESDDYFREQIVQGHVHDMGAAMLGGVSGHAGLFSNSKELAELMQMLINGGVYAGKSYLKPQTINKFAQRYYKSTRRGLGFDMKELDEDKTANMAAEASDLTFGHLGFTGIAVFADPKYDLIYVFLSNRTYPSMKNNVFHKENYRPRVQSVFYKSLMADPN